MNRGNHILLAAMLGLLLPFAATVADEEDANSFASAMTSGEVGISGRYRYEHVDEDNALKNANASTLRLRLNYRTGSWKGWSAFAEFDHVFHLLLDDFNSGQGTSQNLRRTARRNPAKAPTAARPNHCRRREPRASMLAGSPRSNPSATTWSSGTASTTRPATEGSEPSLTS